jgi:hypothetical protein
MLDNSLLPYDFAVLRTLVKGLTNSLLQLSIEYVVIIPIFETIDSICSEIKLRPSDPRGTTITVWVEGPQISADSKLEGSLNFPILVGEGW